MATPVIESVASNTATGATSVTITKPSGTVDGNLLVAIIFTFENGASNSIPSDEAGWTTIGSQQDGTGSLSLKTYYKTASSEGANYTFDSASTEDVIGGIVYRISGWDTSAPIGGGGTSASTTATPSVTVSNDPFVANALLILGVATEGTSSADISAYNISGTNPSWTEQYKYNTNTTEVYASASGTATSGAEITSVGWTLPNTGTGHIGTIISIEGVENGDGSIASVNVNLTASVDSTGTTTADLDTNTTNFTSGATDSNPVNPTVWTTTLKS